ncbi:MAG: trehalose-phosphatase [Aeromicrobium erythreum]
MPAPDPAVLADPAGTLLALDFDGTLAHVVEDPTRAYAHPGSVTALERLAPRLGALAIVTGRPVRQALELGGFRDRPAFDHLLVRGQYGAERWDAATGRLEEPQRPAGVEDLARRLPGWLAEHEASHVRLEDKGLAIALHTRGIDPDLLDRLDGPLRELATQVGLVVEPGRQVVELRAPGTDKGVAIRALVDELRPAHVVFAGDDLGDLPAFEALTDLRAEGRVTATLVCSASGEQDALVALADLVLDGPDAVAAWLTGLADSLPHDASV